MSFIRLRRKNAAIACAAGACIAGIPLAAAAAYMGVSLSGCRTELAQVKEEAETAERAQGYILKHDLQESHVIMEEDLVRISIVGEEGSIYEALSEDQVIGKRCSLSMKKGAVISSAVLYEGEEILPDLRLQDFTHISLPEGLEKDDYVDIRIVFPDGEDYIVAGHKKVLGTTAEVTEAEGSGAEAGPGTESVSLCVSEEEILRLASAYVDTMLYKDAELYAIKYVEEFQKPAKTNYPVNPQVFGLMGWDPNMGEKIYFEGEEKRRETLNGNIAGYLNGSLGSVLRSEENPETDVSLNGNGADASGEYAVKEDKGPEEIEFFE